MDATIREPQRHRAGDGDFRTIGNEFLRHFRDLGGLRPYHHVLDVGCGAGRMAIPLTTYLTSGTYRGFDIIPEAVDWCRENVTATYPHFQFEHADVRHRAYHRAGRIDACRFSFPYCDEEFDFVIATSVFTHLFAKDCERYVAECARVLRPGGKLFATFFLLNDESQALIRDGISPFRFRFRKGVCQYQKWWTPEAAVAYPESEAIAMLHRHGFEQCALHLGNWCGRRDFVSGQDIVIAVKTSET